MTLVVIDALEKAYLAGFLPLLIFVSIFPQLGGCDKSMEFLPLMVTSVYSAAGMIWGFFRLLTIYLVEGQSQDH